MCQAVDEVEDALTKLKRDPWARAASADVAEEGVAVVIVETEAYGSNGVPGEGVGDKIFLARNMLQGAVELGYRRQVTLLTGRMRV